MNQLTASTAPATECQGSFRIAKIAAATSLLVAVQVAQAGLLIELPSPLPDASKQSVRGTQAAPAFSNSEVVESVRPRRQLDLTSQLTQRIRQKGIPPRELPPIIGAGYDVTIADALKQIVPGGWMVYSEHDFPEDMSVSWQGNRNWPMTLNTVLISANMKAEIDWERGEVTLSKGNAATPPPSAPAQQPAHPNVAAASPFATTPVIAPAPVPAATPVTVASPTQIQADTIAKARAHLAVKAAQGDKSAQAAHDALASGAVVAAANPSSQSGNTPVIVVVQQPAPQPAPIIVQQPAPVAAAQAPVAAQALPLAPAPVMAAPAVQTAPVVAQAAPSPAPAAPVSVANPIAQPVTAPEVANAPAVVKTAEGESKKLVAYKPAPTWKLNKDMFLRENIRAWAEREGWTLEWQATVGDRVINYPINADAELRGELIGEGGVIHRLIAKYERADEPLGVRFYRGNRVVVVFPYSKTTTSYEQK